MSYATTDQCHEPRFSKNTNRAVDLSGSLCRGQQRHQERAHPLLIRRPKVAMEIDMSGAWDHPQLFWLVSPCNHNHDRAIGVRMQCRIMSSAGGQWLERSRLVAA
jgi:hypothetical protein